MNKNSLPLLTLMGSLFLLAVCGITAYLLPHIPLVWQITGAVGLIALVGYFVIERAFFAEVFSRKTTRYGLNSIFMSLIFLAVMVMLNLIAS
jgi:hypothetical protein